MGGGGDGSSVSDSGELLKPDAGPAALDEGFEDAIACLGWSAVGPATRQPHTDGHDAVGSCQLCATAAGNVFLEKTVTAPQAARYELATWAKRPSGATPEAFTARFISNASTISGGTSLSSSWTEVRSLKIPLSKDAPITVQVGIEAAAVGDCILVDDVTLTIN
jgi:hypothetical protein